MPTLIASYFVASGTANTGALATPSFTPSNGEVIVVKAATWDTTISMGTPTGGSQTYTQRVVAAPGGFNGWAGVWTATVSGSPGSMTVSSTPSASSQHNMVVERWGSAQLAVTPAVNSTLTGVSTAPSANITTVAANSVVTWCITDEQSLDPTGRAYLLSATEDGLYDGHVGSNSVQYFAYAAVGAAGTYAMGMSTPNTQKWVLAGVEVEDNSGAAAVWLPTWQSRRRPPGLPRRLQGRSATPVPAQVNPPFPVAEVKQPRQIRGLRARRGKAVTPVPPQFNPPFPFAEVVQPHRLRGLPTRRGKSVAPIPPQVNPPFPFTDITQPRRMRGILIRRGKTVQPVQTQAAAVAPTWVPQPARSRLKPTLLRRRPPTAVPPAGHGSPHPQPQRSRPRLPALPRHGRQSSVPLGAHAHVPQATTRPKTRPVPLRRGRTSMPPTVHAHAPQTTRPRTRIALRVQPRTRPVVPPQIFVAPPAFPPQGSHMRSRLFFLRRRRLGVNGWMVGSGIPKIVIRPHDGTVTRPGTGGVVRPFSGFVIRP